MTDDTTRDDAATIAELDEPVEVDDENATGYAAYDETLLRYFGGVHPTRAAAKKAGNAAPNGHDVTVRKV